MKTSKQCYHVVKHGKKFKVVPHHSILLTDVRGSVAAYSDIKTANTHASTGKDPFFDDTLSFFKVN